MIYKIKMMSGVEIPVENEEALQKFLKRANSGEKLVLTTYGIVNVASVDSIVPHKEKLEEVRQFMEMGYAKEKAEGDTLGTSPFAKLIMENQKQLK